MRSRLFRSIVGVAFALAPSGCEDSELVPRTFDAVAPETASEDSGVAIDSGVDTADTAAADVAAETADTYTDAPTDADASDGWPPTK